MRLSDEDKQAAIAWMTRQFAGTNAAETQRDPSELQVDFDLGRLHGSCYDKESKTILVLMACHSLGRLLKDFPEIAAAGIHVVAVSSGLEELAVPAPKVRKPRKKGGL